MVDDPANVFVVVNLAWLLYAKTSSFYRGWKPLSVFLRLLRPPSAGSQWQKE